MGFGPSQLELLSRSSGVLHAGGDGLKEAMRVARHSRAKSLLAWDYTLFSTTLDASEADWLSTGQNAGEETRLKADCARV